jgi:hypothetical protein
MTANDSAAGRWPPKRKTKKHQKRTKRSEACGITSAEQKRSRANARDDADAVLPGPDEHPSAALPNLRKSQKCAMC